MSVEATLLVSSVKILFVSPLHCKCQGFGGWYYARVFVTATAALQYPCVIFDMSARWLPCHLTAPSHPFSLPRPTKNRDMTSTAMHGENASQRAVRPLLSLATCLSITTSHCIWKQTPGVSYKLLCRALLPSSSYLNFPYITRLQRSQNSPHALSPKPALLAQSPYTTTFILMQAVMSPQLAELVVTQALEAAGGYWRTMRHRLAQVQRTEGEGGLDRLLFALPAPFPQTSPPLKSACHMWSNHLRVQISVLVEEKQAAELRKLGGGFGRRRVTISTFCLLQRGTTGKGMKDGWRRLWEVVGTLTGLAGVGVEERRPADHSLLYESSECEFFSTDVLLPLTRLQTPFVAVAIAVADTTSPHPACCLQPLFISPSLPTSLVSADDSTILYRGPRSSQRRIHSTRPTTLMSLAILNNMLNIQIPYLPCIWFLCRMSNRRRLSASSEWCSAVPDLADNQLAREHEDTQASLFE
ncbi:hypothetical protein OE88DRAFT_1734669 [Heliocybe sulcata]|uniref:Uncharacterized protein n=1 Tax=Heliocybe sulcata TaxID=5364 RepID=A0A5C3N3R7_9AGAM|nr:hypothetical protein OE88DRAFT_1734669 [Heliocybe sulcata]